MIPGLAQSTPARRKGKTPYQHALDARARAYEALRRHPDLVGARLLVYETLLELLTRGACGGYGRLEGYSAEAIARIVRERNPSARVSRSTVRRAQNDLQAIRWVSIVTPPCHASGRGELEQPARIIVAVGVLAQILVGEWVAPFQGRVRGRPGEWLRRRYSTLFA